MTASKFSKLLYNGFGIKSVIINNIDIKEKSIAFECLLKSRLKKCSKCKSYNVHVKDTKTRRLRLVPLGKLACFLVITIHKFKCQECHSSSWVNLPFAVGKLPMSRAFVNHILSMVKIGTIQSISKFLGLNWNTVKNIHKDWLTKKYKKLNYNNLTYISVDEFSMKKGHKYMTVFTDIRTGRIVYAIEGRRVEDIAPFLRKLKKRAKKLKAIAMDMSKSYISAVKNILPNVSIVFDRFHIMKLLNESLDLIRKEEFRKAKELGLDIGKGDRFLFLYNFENLEDDKKSKLQTLLDINKPLSIAHTMKEQFRTFWDKESKMEAAKFLIRWIYEAINSEIKLLVKTAKTILDHSEGLLNYFDHTISNGKAEGVNNKIKVLKRNGYGYLDIEYFILLLYDLHEKKTQLVG